MNDREYFSNSSKLSPLSPMARRLSQACFVRACLVRACLAIGIFVFYNLAASPLTLHADEITYLPIIPNGTQSLNSPSSDVGAGEINVRIQMLEVAEDLLLEVEIETPPTPDNSGTDGADQVQNPESLVVPARGVSTSIAEIPSEVTIVTIPSTLTPNRPPNPPAPSKQEPQSESNQPTTFYVSRSGNNSTGTSWSNAWNELDQIDWSRVQPGTTIKIDGGSSQMVYKTQLVVNKSGRSGAPITIQLATDSSRNGTVVIDGGRGTTLPYCGQSSYSDNASSARRHGIVVDDSSWVVIDGIKWDGIIIRRHMRSGIYLDRDTSNITIRNMEIHDNGSARRSGQGWISAKPGVRLGGHHHTLDWLNVHDNGEDAIQSLWGENNIGNITISRSWLHNERRHPSVNEASNYCTHTDGVQIYDGGNITGLTIEESIIGPGVTNGLILGQTLVGNNTWAKVDNVVIRDTIFTKATDNAIYAYQNSNARNWTMNNLTLDCTTTKYNCINMDTAQHKINNSITHSSRIYFKRGLNHYGNNCQWRTTGFQIGATVDPKFASINETDRFALNDYRMPANSPCAGRGASITSVQDLIDSHSTTPPPSDPPPSDPPPSDPPPSDPPPSDPPPSDPPPSNPPPSNPSPSGAVSCNSSTGILIEAEKGYLWGSFGTENGTLRQLFDVDKPWNGFLATYRFEVQQSGTYHIRARVSAPDTDRNSFYVNMDAEPIGSSEKMVWDIPPTSGFADRLITWRGSGDETNNQYNPITFELNSGTHSFIIRGREANTLLDQICIELR